MRTLRSGEYVKPGNNLSNGGYGSGGGASRPAAGLHVVSRRVSSHQSELTFPNTLRNSAMSLWFKGGSNDLLANVPTQQGLQVDDGSHGGSGSRTWLGVEELIRIFYPLETKRKNQTKITSSFFLLKPNQ